MIFCCVIFVASFASSAFRVARNDRDFGFFVEFLSDFKSVFGSFDICCCNNLVLVRIFDVVVLIVFVCLRKLFILAYVASMFFVYLFTFAYDIFIEFV